MTLSLVLALAAVTYASRALLLVAAPVPSARLHRVLSRIPAPLFAGLAALSILDPPGGLAPWPVLAAFAGAVVAAPVRSLAVALIGGLAGYAVAALMVSGRF